MPAAKKPAGQQLGKHSAPKTLTALPASLVVIPDPPADLLQSTLDEWTAFWSSDIGSTAVQTDRPTIERLFTYRDMWRKARAIYENEPMVVGSTGQPKMNPAADQMLKLETHMSTLEGKLGMTPYDRQRLGLAIGKAVLTAAEVNALANRGPAETEAEEAQVIDIEAEWK